MTTKAQWRTKAIKLLSKAHEHTYGPEEHDYCHGCLADIMEFVQAVQAETIDNILKLIEKNKVQDSKALHIIGAELLAHEIAALNQKDIT